MDKELFNTFSRRQALRMTACGFGGLALGALAHRVAAVNSNAVKRGYNVSCISVSPGKGMQVEWGF